MSVWGLSLTQQSVHIFRIMLFVYYIIYTSLIMLQGIIIKWNGYHLQNCLCFVVNYCMYCRDIPLEPPFEVGHLAAYHTGTKDFLYILYNFVYCLLNYFSLCPSQGNLMMESIIYQTISTTNGLLILRLM